MFRVVARMGRLGVGTAAAGPMTHDSLRCLSARPSFAGPSHWRLACKRAFSREGREVCYRHNLCVSRSRVSGVCMCFVYAVVQRLGRGKVFESQRHNDGFGILVILKGMLHVFGGKAGGAEFG